MNGRKRLRRRRWPRQERPRQARQQGKDGQRRPMFRRRKVCKFCADKIDDINYKDAKLLMPFVPERAKMLPRRISGTCAHAPAEAAHGDHARAPARADPVHRGVELATYPLGPDRVLTDEHMEVILRDTSKAGSAARS